MKVLQKDGGFTQEELLAFKPVCFANANTQMKVILQAMPKLGLELRPEMGQYAQLLSQAQPTDWNSDLGGAIKTLWQDPGVQKAYELRGTAYHLHDSAKHFFENVDRYVKPDFVPSVDDALRARVRTTGIEEAKFTFEDFTFRMCDVGGQRSERSKWIHYFENITAVIYCAAISEYDQVLREDKDQNRVIESMVLFRELINSVWFKETTFILFLNKKDIFAQKIVKKDLKICFPEYTGGLSYDNATAFLETQFKSIAGEHPLYIHFTCAIDTDQVRFVFQSVKEQMLKFVLSVAF